VCSFLVRSIHGANNTSGEENYATISYYWGVEDEAADRPLKRIELQTESNPPRTRPWDIRENLWAALRSLRSSTKDRLFWVDALCINYTKELQDTAEKTSQTKLKRHIFMGANNLCFWLGDDEKIRPAFMFISTMLEKVGGISELVNDHKYIPSWLSFIALLNNKAFSRLWLLQEVTISQRRSVTIHAGNLSKNYLDFVDAVGIFISCRGAISDLFRKHQADHKALSDHGISLTELFVNVSTNALRYARKDSEAQRLLALEDLVSQLVNFGCGNPLDRVFSMLALAKDKTRYLDINYSKDTIVVYKEFVRHVIITSQSLDIVCRRWATPHQGTPYPSWILASPSLPSMFRGRINADSLVGLPGRSHYNASRNKPAYDIHMMSWNADILPASGFVLDTISKLGDWASQGIILSQWLSLGGCNLSDGELVTDAFWRTLVANLGPNGCNPPPWYPRALGFCIDHRTPNGDIDTEKLLAKDTDPLIKEFLKRVQSVIWNRKFLVTKQLGLVGLVPMEAQIDDSICILYGCSVPVVLRRHSDGQFWRFIGECYVHDMMDGEAVELMEGREHFKAEIFPLK